MRILLTIVAILIGFAVKAQEVPDPKPMYVRGGILCDTKEELQTLLTQMSLKNGQWPDQEDVPATCGRFAPRQPVLMIITPSEWYHTPFANVLLAHFLYPPNGWEQWGYVAFTPNPNFQPSSDS